MKQTRSEMIIDENMNNINNPNNFIGATLRKVRLKSFLMFIILTLHQKWPSTSCPFLASRQNGCVDYQLVGVQREHPHQMWMEC